MKKTDNGRPVIVRYYDPALPYSNNSAARNLVANMRLISVVDWLKEATFDEVVTWYWYAQGLKAADTERERLQAARRAEYAQAREEA